LKNAQLYALFAALSVSRSPRRAELGRFHRTWSRPSARLAAANGPKHNAALRRVCRHGTVWTEPPVEEPCARPSRAEARTAVPRLCRRSSGLRPTKERAEFQAAQAKIQADLGFVSTWCGRSVRQRGQARLGTDFGPELDLGRPSRPARPTRAKERPVRWRRVRAAVSLRNGSTREPWSRPAEGLRLCRHVRPGPSGFAVCRARLRSGSARPVRSSCYSTDNQCSVNGAYGGTHPDRLATTVTLEPGMNSVLLKLCWR